MLFSNISILNENFDIQKNMDVQIEGSTIKKITPHDKNAKKDNNLKVYEGNDSKLLMPAFYNAHAHVPMTLLRGYAENLPLNEWLNDTVWPFEAKIDDDAAYWATKLAIAEMLRFGIVSFSDMYYFTKSRIKAVQESGIKINICDGATMVFEETDYDTLDVKNTNDWLMTEIHNQGDGKIRGEFCIHGEYTTPKGMIQRMREEALKYDTGIHMHVSETKNEVEECRERHDGKSPVEYFADLGIFDVPVTAAHCVWTTSEDLDILSEHNVNVALNPASNMKLASGFAPVKEMIEKDVNICIGTDGVASNNAHNMLRDVYLLSTIYKGSTLDPTVVTPKEAIKAATKNGAVAQGRKDCGVIKEGNKADLIVLNCNTPWMYPVTDLLTNVVYSASGSDIELTMVDGKVLYQNNEWPTLDIERITREVQNATERIAKSV